MPKLINFSLMSNPLNWAIVATMVSISVVGAVLIDSLINGIEDQ